jgi:hypothetical protein
VTSMHEEGALTEGERAELERLHAEEPTLGSQAPEGSGPDEGRPRRRRWRTVVAVLLIVLGCVLAPLAGVAVWARNQVTNTDRYVATVAPLASDPAIQNAVADKITAQVFTYIDVKGLTTQALDALTSQGLAPRLGDQLRALAVPIDNGVESFTRTQVGKVVQSQAFADAWVQANRAAHEELVKALTGEGGGAITVENDTVTLNMAAFVQVVKERLTASGFALAARIPQVNASFVLFQSDDITKARSAFKLLNTLGNWLPVIALVLLAAGVYVAKDHRRALVGAALGVAAGMVVLALGAAGVPVGLPQRRPRRRAAARRRGGAVRHHRAVPARRAACRPGAGAGGGRRGLPDRPVGHRRPDPPELGACRRLAAGQCRRGRVAHRPGRRLGL